jgi:Trk-type K+ transport system membrane component
MVLIQVGGLGIMAFTGFLGYIFSGSASIKERLLLKDIFSGEKLSVMFKILAKIILLTIILETVGTILIYYSLGDLQNDKLFFSAFHAVSAFCNAGFSTFPEGLANSTIMHNTFLQLIVSFLVILGGIGFPVLFYFYSRTKDKGLNLVLRLTKSKKKIKQYPFFVGQSLALRTTIVLLLLGTIFYFLLEKQNSLAGLSTSQQFVTAFFSSASARTAGFNIIDISLWGYPTVFIMLFLMWVGASPGSTGGGIKTTTFALALKTAFGFCRGQKHIEIGNRELGLPTILKVLAIITFSLIIIFCSTILLLIFDPEKSPTGLLFESISAFSTVGLSIVNTASLSDNSKIVLILLMYVGRIGPILLLTGLLPVKKNNYYRMPVENLTIN